MINRLKNNFGYIMMALSYTLLFLLRYGYQFGTGDQEEHLPPIYQLINPELYPNDFFMNYYQAGFNIRFYFVEFFYRLQKIFPLQSLFFLFWLGCTFWMCFIWQKITFILSLNKISAVLSPLFIFFIFYKFTLGSSEITYNLLIGGVVANTFLCTAIYFFLKEKYGFCGFLIGIASLFQVLFALQLFLIFGFIMFINFGVEDYKKILLYIVGFALVSTFILYPMYNDYFFNATPEQSELFNKILFYFRAPWHYIPSAFNKLTYLKFSLIVLVYVFGIFTSEVKHKKTLILFFACFSGIAILYTLLVEVAQITSIAKLQWFGSSIWISAFAGVLASVFIANFTKNIKININRFSIFITLFTVLLFISVFTVQSKLSNKIRNKIMFGNFDKDNLIKAHIWIENNTPTNAVFVVFPQDVSFSCQAKRSLIVSPHAFIHQAIPSIHWYNLYSKIYGTNLESNTLHYKINKYINLNNDVLKGKKTYVLYRNNIDKIISTKPIKAIYSNAEYTVAVCNDF